MNLTNRNFLAIAIVAASMLLATVIGTSLLPSAVAATGGCGCSSEVAPCDACVTETACTKERGCGCNRCRKPRAKVNCPSCAVECDTCSLKLDHYEQEKKCFKTEQKTVCIPPVRFPWEECCPPGRTNKTRAINVLKVHKYKCKACGYKWELDELPEPAKPAEPAEQTATDTAANASTPAQPQFESPSDAPPSVDPVVAPVESQNLLAPPADAPQPGFETPSGSAGKVFDAVPPAPAG